MKFNDIPQLTRSGNYEIWQPLDGLLKTYHKWLEDGLIPIPDFQRGHVWEQEQQTKFVEFLLRGGWTNNTIYMNHPGWMTSFKGEWVIVDGLQRLTACIKFIENKLPIFGRMFLKDFEGHLPFDVHLKMNVNNLKTRKEVLQWYLEMNEGSTPHSSQELARVRELIKKEK